MALVPLVKKQGTFKELQPDSLSAGDVFIKVDWFSFFFFFTRVGFVLNSLIFYETFMITLIAVNL